MAESSSGETLRTPVYPHSIFLVRDYNEVSTKPLPAPFVPGNTDAERMDAAVRKMFAVSKEAVLKQEAKEKREREKKRAAKKPH